jgi:hypothetical protein
MDLVEILSYKDIKNEIIIKHLDLRSFLKLQVNKQFQSEIFSEEWLADSFGNISTFPEISMNSLYRLLLIDNLSNCDCLFDIDRFGYVGYIGVSYPGKRLRHPYQSIVDKFLYDMYGKTCIIF